MVEIPIDSPSPEFTESVNVGDVSLSMRFMWNNRDAHWYVDFESVDGKNNGIRVEVGTPLLSNKNKCLKGGDIVALQTVTDEMKELGFENLGKEFSLFYLTDGEVAQYVYAMSTMEDGDTEES